MVFIAEPIHGCDSTLQKKPGPMLKDILPGVLLANAIVDDLVVQRTHMGCQRVFRMLP